MVVAKHDRAHAELARQFADREVEKEYVALVWGLVQQGRRIDLPSRTRPRLDRKRISVRSRRAREAVTRVGDGGGARRRHARPRGNRHRPDPPDPGPPERYRPSGGRRLRVRWPETPPAALVAGRPAVGATLPPRCARLAFTHPRDGRRIVVLSALPDGLQDLADEIRAHHPETRRRLAGARRRSRRNRRNRHEGTPRHRLPACAPFRLPRRPGQVAAGEQVHSAG